MYVCTYRMRITDVTMIPVPTPQQQLIANSCAETNERLAAPNTTMSIDMVFNEGHILSVVVYSILLMISSFGNISVFITIVR